MAITVAEIDANCIRHNLKIIRELTNGKSSILAMVKANGYGHSMLDVARVFRKEKVEYLGVAIVEEARKLRENGDLGKILVMVSPEPKDADFFIDNNVETAFSSFKILEHFAKRAAERNSTITGHLYLDTGMHRDGISCERALEFMEFVRKNPQIQIVGLMTHLATADMPEIDFANVQISLFEKTRKMLADKGFNFKYCHVANSAGILNYPEAHYNLVRPGISLYGHMPTAEMAKQIDLKPVMRWTSKVMLIKDIKKGSTVGYGMTYIAPKDTKIAIIPVGYGDGLLRSLSNNYQCLINGKRYNNVGSICMDEFMVDLGSGEDVKLCDEVVILGQQGNEEILPYEIADKTNSIPYEITSNVSGRVKKILVNEEVK